MPAVSLTATLVATILGFVLGALWYGPIFGKPWMAAVGVSREQLLDGFNPAKDRKSTRLNSSHVSESRMPSSA